jgi:multiple sugar transport system substrate-binding protein
VAGLILVFAGCAGSDTDVVVTLRWVTDPNPARKLQIELFRKKHPNIDVYVDQASTGMMAKVLVQLAAHAGPDLIDIYTPDHLAYFAEYGALLPISEKCEAAGIDTSQFWPQCRHWMEYKGELFGIPTNGGTFVLFYNRDHFDEAGLAHPDETWTWDDYMDAARKLTVRNEKTNRVERYGCYPSEPRHLIWQAGGEMWNDEMTVCTLDSPEVKRAFDLYFDARMKHRVAPSLGDEQSFAAGGWGGGNIGSPIPLFASGKVSMLDTGRFGIVSFRQYQKDQKRAGERPLRFGIAPLPRDATRASWFLSRSTTINAETPYPDECFKFLEFLTTPEYNRLICEGGDGLPSVKALAESDMFLSDPNYPEEDQNQVYLDDIPYGRVDIISPYIKPAEYQKIWDTYTIRLREGTWGPEKAADEMARRVNEAMRRNIAEGVVF